MKQNIVTIYDSGIIRSLINYKDIGKIFEISVIDIKYKSKPLLFIRCRVSADFKKSRLELFYRGEFEKPTDFGQLSSTIEDILSKTSEEEKVFDKEKFLNYVRHLHIKDENSRSLYEKIIERLFSISNPGNTDYKKFMYVWKNLRIF